MNDNDEKNRMDKQVVDHSQKVVLQDEDFHLSDYESGSEEEIMVEFARNSYPLVGAVIDGKFIKGDFGYGQIQQPKNQRLIKLQNNKLTIVEKVSKIIVTKSTLSTNKNKNTTSLQHNQSQIKQKQNQQSPQHQNIILNDDKPIQISYRIQQPQLQAVEVQDEQRFFSESSEQSDEEHREHAANRINKKSIIRKSSSNQNNKHTNKLSKNILKKKLKYLSTKK